MEITEESHSRLSGILKEFVNGRTYADLRPSLSDASIGKLESDIMIETGASPQTIIKTVLNILRNEFELDYDDLVLAGGWMNELPRMIARNYLLRHFLELGNGLENKVGKFYDATLNSAADDYTGFVDLIVIKIQTLGEERHYSFEPEDVTLAEQYLQAILVLMEYCWDMLDMSSTLRPSLFQMRNRRMEGRIKGVIEMSVFRKDYPYLLALMKDVSLTVERISNDEGLRALQTARNERYKQSKIRLYRYTIRCAEDLNNQLESCDPYDFTHRADLRKQLEQVQIFQRSFDKDR